MFNLCECGFVFERLRNVTTQTNLRRTLWFRNVVSDEKKKIIINIANAAKISSEKKMPSQTKTHLDRYVVKCFRTHTYVHIDRASTDINVFLTYSFTLHTLCARSYTSKTSCGPKPPLPAAIHR